MGVWTNFGRPVLYGWWAETISNAQKRQEEIQTEINKKEKWFAGE